jgi:protoporphyrinogen oxidase
MAEITYRKDDLVDLQSDAEIAGRVASGLQAAGFITDQQDINFIEIKRFDYAYVIYDLMHRKNMDAILRYFKKEGVDLLGRFGSFEYLNMDAIMEQAFRFSRRAVNSDIKRK